MKLLTFSNTKTLKGQVKLGFLTAILHLAPHRLSGYNTCPKATAGCSAACLNTAGRGKFNSIQESRIRKTREFFENRSAFMDQLVKDVRATIRKAARENLTPAIRLNGTSDIRWETVGVGGFKNIMEMFPEVQFYDYTKIPNRRNIPSNYHLTFSLAENNDGDAVAAINNGMNVAAVFKENRKTFMGLPVINGDDTDLRFLDRKGCIVGLSAKGEAKKDTTGFVR